MPIKVNVDLSINADAKKNENGSPNVTNTIMAKTINPKITFIISSLYIYFAVIANIIALNIIKQTQVKNPPDTIKPIDNIIKANMPRTIESDKIAKIEKITTISTTMKPVKNINITNSF